MFNVKLCLKTYVQKKHQTDQVVAVTKIYASKCIENLHTDRAQLLSKCRSSKSYCSVIMCRTTIACYIIKYNRKYHQLWPKISEMIQLSSTIGYESLNYP